MRNKASKKAKQNAYNQTLMGKASAAASAALKHLGDVAVWAAPTN